MRFLLGLKAILRKKGTVLDTQERCTVELGLIIISGKDHRRSGIG